MTEAVSDRSAPYSDDPANFQLEIARNKAGNVLYYLFTPLNYAAIDKSKSLFPANTVRWGKSFVTNIALGIYTKNLLNRTNGLTLTQ